MTGCLARSKSGIIAELPVVRGNVSFTVDAALVAADRGDHKGRVYGGVVGHLAIILGRSIMCDFP